MAPEKALTQKQAEVLAFVYQGLSSKEIALRLGISPATVDQRADGARRKLGAATRIEAARIHAARNNISERFIYSPPPLTGDQRQAPSPEPPRDSLRFEDSVTFDQRASWDRDRSWRVPEFEPRDFGIASRLVIIVGLAVLIMLAVAESLRLADSLGVMFTA